VVTFVYSATDSNTPGSNVTATVTLTIGPPPPPTAVLDKYTTPKDTELVVPASPRGLLTNDTTPSPGAVLTVVAIARQPDYGSLVAWAPDGSFTWRPPVGFVGMATFEYT
jgi:hypothetical protein